MNNLGNMVEGGSDLNRGRNNKAAGSGVRRGRGRQN